MPTDPIEFGLPSPDVPEQELLPEIARLQETMKARTTKLALPDLETMHPELLAIAEELERLTGRWNAVALYTPSGENVESERERFLEARKRGERIEPVFTYPVAERTEFEEPRAALRELDRRVRALEPGTEIERLARISLHFKIQDDVATCDVIEGIRTKDERLIKRGFERMYPGTDPVLVERAERQYVAECLPHPATRGKLADDEIRWLKKRIVTPEEQAKGLEWALKEIGILRSPECPDGFNVIVSSDVTSIDVRDKCEGGPTIFVPATRDGRDIDALEFCALQNHEVIGHARQAMNGRRRGLDTMRKHDESLYEGLGMRYENDFMRKWAGRVEAPESPLYVLAVSLAEEGKGFSRIVDDQERRWLHVYGKIPADQPIPDSLDPAIRDKALKRAYRTAYRVMRGHTDMSNPEGYAMAKDVAYFRGVLLDEQLQAAGLGVLNEAAIMSPSALRMVARFDVNEENLPYPFKDVGSEYLQRFLEEKNKIRPRNPTP